MSDPEIVNDVLAAYHDRENRPAPESFGPRTAPSSSPNSRELTG